jgi:hypothetical protein
MENIVVTSSLPTAQAATAAPSNDAVHETPNVVKHDSAAIDQAQAKTPMKTAYASIEQLVIEREVWEQTVYRTSNDMLYGLLQKCYGLYKSMEGMSADAIVLRSGLTDYINLKNIKCASTSHTLVKIVKCVFGDDRRRASAYGIVLRAALAEKKAVADIPTFIRDNGGVEEIRLAKAPNALTSKQKASVSVSALQNGSMGVFSSAELSQKLDAGNIGKPVVLIGFWQADGSVRVQAMVQSDTAVTAALSSFYGTAKASLSLVAQQQQAANDSQIAKDAVTQAVSEATSMPIAA